jgi:hypothetical protein
MGLMARVCLSLSAFLLVAGTVYGLTSHEHAGTTMLLVASATFCFLGLVTRSIAKREAGEEPQGDQEHGAEIEVAPTIWPFVFSLSAVLLMLGIIATPWLAVLGGVVFLLSAAGWVRDVTRSRAHADGS